ncbi:MAG: YraN family protein [Bacteroidota bacterium]
MDNRIETGKSGEQIAADHLLAKGYQILERNWHFGREELDVIAKHENFIVIVEVKTRTGKTEIEPAEVVPRAKQRILIRAANAYMAYKNLPGEIRFDIITILMNARGTQLHHLEDAFYATL